MGGKLWFFDLIFWGLGEQLEEVITLTFFKTKMSLLSGAEHSLIPGWHRVREKGALTYSQVVHSPPPPNFFSATIFARLKRETCFYSTPKVYISLRHILFQTLSYKEIIFLFTFVCYNLYVFYKEKIAIVLWKIFCYFCTFHFTLRYKKMYCKHFTKSCKCNWRKNCLK